MNPEHERPGEEELADRLWRVITTIQAMTDRLLAQCEKSARGGDADLYSLTGLTPV